jgi:hypothetical protein
MLSEDGIISVEQLLNRKKVKMIYMWKALQTRLKFFPCIDVFERSSFR